MPEDGGAFTFMRKAWKAGTCILGYRDDFNPFEKVKSLGTVTDANLNS